MVTEKQVEQALKKVTDPEIGLDIVTLELIYGIAIKGSSVKIKMTMTTPFCPFADAILDQVKEAVKKIKGVKKVEVELVFDPPWEPSEELKATLGLPV